MEAKNKIQSLESKSGWFERRLTETEVLSEYFLAVLSQGLQ